MPHGYITEQIDLAQIMVAAFIGGFCLLVYYLRREDKREGYPLEAPEPGGRRLIGFPEIPTPKTFNLLDGGTTQMPHTANAAPHIAAVPLGRYPGAPLVPLGNPMLAGVGPGSFALRREVPLVMTERKLQVLPMRVLPDWKIMDDDTDPRGMRVVGADGQAAGIVRDIWIDRSVKILRYLEVELAPGDCVLLPIYFADISDRRRRIRVRAIATPHFAEVPRLSAPDVITAREEDRINAFYSAGPLYGKPAIVRGAAR